MRKWGKLAIVVERSSNRKLGPLGAVSTTSVPQTSCPTSCVFLGAGCYAEYGFVGMAATRPLNQAAKKQKASVMDVARAEAAGIDKLSGTRPLRLHVVGDCRTEATAGIIGNAASRYRMRKGWSAAGWIDSSVWTYTHAWRTVRRLAWGGAVSVLASVESLADAMKAMGRGYAAAIVVDEHRSDKAWRDKATGVLVIPCPEETRGVKCTQCRLCWRDKQLRERGAVIAFATHSAGKAKAVAALPA